MSTGMTAVRWAVQDSNSTATPQAGQSKPQWGFGYAAEGAKALPNHFARKPLSETVSYL